MARKVKTARHTGVSELDAWFDRISFLSESMESTAQPFGCGYPDGRLLLCNDALCKLLGYSKNELQEKINWSDDLTPPQYRDFEVGKLDEINRTGKPHRYEKEYIRKDGTRVPVELLVHPALDSRGNILFYYSFVTDVTERKRAEAALRESEERLAALMNNNPSLVFMKDESGRYVYLNNAYEKQFVHDKDWFGKTDFDFWPKESAELFRANDSEVLRSGRTHQFVEDSTDLQGKRYCWLNYKFPFTDSNGNKYVGGIGIDATDRIRAEEALRESEQKFRAMFEGAGTAIFIADVATGRIIDCNWKAEELTGKSRDELVGLHQTQLHPADKAGVQKEQFARHAKGIVFSKDEAEVLNRDGRVIPVIINAAPLKVNGRDIIIGFFFDITERKQAEEALCKNLSVLAKSQEIAHLGSWTVDFDTGRFELSDEMYRIYGFEPGTVEPTLDLSLKLTHPDDVERYRKFDESMRREGRLGGIDYRIVRPDGSVRYVYAQTDSVVRGPDGRVKTASGVTQDVTDRKRAEQALRESEERFRALADNIPNMVWMADADGRVFWFNKQWYDYTGTKPEEMRDWGWLKAHHPDYAQRVKGKWLSSIKAGRRHENVAFIRGKDGNYRWFLTRVTPIRDERGNIHRWFGTNTDITERKRAEDALEEKERLLAAAQGLARLGSWKLDLATGEATFSDETYRILGLPPGRYVYEDYRGRVHPDDRERRDREVKDAIDHDRQYSCEYRIVRPDGEVRNIHAVGRASRDSSGKPVSITATIQDITERKRAEEALRESEVSLARAQRIAHIGSWEWDIINDVDIWSEETYRIFGVKPGEFGGNFATFIERVHPDDRDRVREAANKAIHEKVPFSYDYRIILSDGAVRYLHNENEVMTDSGGNVVKLRGTVQDITGRKRAEEDRVRLIHDLGERVKELRALHGVYEIFQKGRSIPEVLQGFTAILPPAWQYPEVTVARISFNGQEYRTPNFRETPWTQRADFSTFDGRNGSIEICYTEERRKEVDGPFLAEERALIDSLAEMLRTYLDKSFSEEALVKAKNQAELYLDLMGHDINNMHQIAMGYLELAQAMHPPEVGEMEFLEKPLEVLRRSAQLIRNVRKLQKLHEGVFQTQDVDVCQVLHAMQREFGSIPGKAIKLNMNGCDRCQVRANELLHDVFANLVGNAIKHTGSETVINIGLDIVNDDGGRYCRVTVEDNGPGIPDDFKARIFNRMLNGTNHEKGIGLGLYLVKSLVDGYGGRVWVEDRVKGDHTKGARFVVMLPAVES